MVPILFILVKLSGVVHKILMAIYAPFLVTGPGIDNRPMGQHGSSFVRDVQKVAVALLALLIFKGGISSLAVTIMVVGLLGKMNDNVFNAVGGLGVEEVECIVRGRQVTIHAVGHKALGIVDMC